MKRIVFHADFISTHHSTEDFSGYWQHGQPEELDKAAKEWANKEANRISLNAVVKGGFKVAKVWITIGPEDYE